jgi:RimJ/RimL family protein N-acetyltransferase
VLITLPTCAVRDWRPDDAPSLAEHANDRRVWLNLRDAFPHPYGLADAVAFIEKAGAMDPRTYFAIAVDGRAAGGIGYALHTDVERISAEIGYWVGAAFWGRGVMTAALRAVTAYAFGEHAELRRIWAVPFAWNPASARVLEKSGYRLEGRMRESALKDGKVVDQMLYAILRGGTVTQEAAHDHNAK